MKSSYKTSVIAWCHGKRTMVFIVLSKVVYILLVYPSDKLHRLSFGRM